MLSVTLIAVGKLKEKWMTEGVEEYLKRLKSYCQFKIVEIPEHKLPTKPSPAEIENALQKEGKAITDKLPSRAKIVTMCIEGSQMTSESLAEILESYSGETSQMVVIIGSSHGLARELKDISDLRLSLSKMTFPHQLARVVVAEQLYRAFSINAGSKYHK